MEIESIDTTISVCDDNNSRNEDDVENDTLMRPFEWLTSSESLKVHLLSALRCTANNSDTYYDDGTNDQSTISNNPILQQHQQQQRQYSVLHVGCGTSVLGEHLLQDPEYNVNYVLNIDYDDKLLQRMKRRWEAKQQQQEESLPSTETTKTSKMITTTMTATIPSASTKKTLDFQCVEFGNHDSKINASDELFDLIVDKGTLDCLLCSPDDAVVSLFIEVHRLLKSTGGIYFIVSFQSSELLYPLLQDLPNANWDVTIEIMNRVVEDLNVYKCADPECSPSTTQQQPQRTEDFNNSRNNVVPKHNIHDEDKYRTVKVVTCRRRPEKTNNIHDTSTAKNSTRSNYLEWDRVWKHIHDTTEYWFQQKNPLLTDTRIQDIYKAFHSASSSVYSTTTTTTTTVPLQEAYEILFTDDEKVHYLFHEDFLQDWYEFCESKKCKTPLAVFCETSMSVETAIEFLKEVQ